MCRWLVDNLYFLEGDLTINFCRNIVDCGIGVRMLCLKGVGQALALLKYGFWIEAWRGWGSCSQRQAPLIARVVAGDAALRQLVEAPCWVVSLGLSCALGSTECMP